MTYCVGVVLEAGMVFASDSRTNAGVDNVSTYRKMTVFERPGDRVIVMMGSGNLSMTQNAINLLEQKSRRETVEDTLWSAQSMFDVAALLGDCLREVKRRDGPYLQQNNIDVNANFIIGGQINGETMRLFMIYPEGNFIEATAETPFFQIGETKYGKPIIDRVMKPSTSVHRRHQVRAGVVRLDHALQRLGGPADRSRLLPGQFPAPRVQAAHRRDRPVLQHDPPPVGRGPAPRVRAAARSLLGGRRAVSGAVRRAPPA